MTVTDDAGIPIDGAIVVAWWELQEKGQWSIHENVYDHSGFLQSQEVKTDSTGRFTLSSSASTGMPSCHCSSGERLDRSGCLPSFWGRAGAAN